MYDLIPHKIDNKKFSNALFTDLFVRSLRAPTENTSAFINLFDIILKEAQKLGAENFKKFTRCSHYFHGFLVDDTCPYNQLIMCKKSNERIKSRNEKEYYTDGTFLQLLPLFLKHKIPSDPPILEQLQEVAKEHQVFETWIEICRNLLS